MEGEILIATCTPVRVDTTVVSSDRIDRNRAGLRSGLTYSWFPFELAPVARIPPTP